MSNYVRHYDVGLLDDLHNFFPAILYEPERFSSVRDLLAYVQSQARNRFDLFSAGARAYQPPTNRTEGNFRAAQAAAARARRQEAPVPVAPPQQRMDNSGSAQPAQRTSSTNETYMLNSVLNSFLGTQAPGITSLLNRTTPANDLFSIMLTETLTPSYGWTVPSNAMEPVVVRPTADQIAAGSAIEIVDAEEEMCAICQDEMPAGSQARCLTACDHRFHVGCIDTWFGRNVHCPVCRHDIREGEMNAVD